ncbi:glycosyltransferase family 61 protein [Chryseobacterium oryzae]|uniref:Glycosyltransferase family 61 protein n=1 Tax=Chryseobacterium oryzae TaxID=2929799 RepID=A0ABY4BH46_9FLAO|nr:glycosyltransferase family 61 protein [Chryseobacterium oryzae]UOE38498.1 glycosyltransferase family 61 protein [Chryseobacterium oryzae]
MTDFLPLNLITSEYYTEREIAKKPENIEMFLPKNFSDSQTTVSTTINAVEIFALRNVYCIPNSTYFLNLKKDKIFYEKWQDDTRIHYVYNTTNLIQHSVTLAKVKNHKNISFNKEAIFLGGTFTFNYYHFFTEILSKIEFFNNIPDAKDKIIVVDKDVEKTENLRELLSIFLKDYKIMFLEHENYYHFEKLWHITSPNYTIPNIMPGEKYESSFSKLSKNSLEYLRKKCFEGINYNKIKIKPVERVFISRKSKFRKYNEDEIFAVAKPYGFEEVFFEDLNIHEQIYLVNNAEYIIGPSGAAWTNILFTKPNAKGLTWLSSVWGDFSIYSTMAKHMNFDLYFYIFPQISDDFHENYILDAEIFSEQLKKLISL